MTPTTVVDRKRLRWALVWASLLLLVVSVVAAWSYYQSILSNRASFAPVDNRTFQTLQNATNNFTIGR